MAHSLECVECGWQEAAHDFPQDYKGVCRCYVSPDPEWEAREWEYIREKEMPRGAPLSDAVWMLTPFGVVDIGS